MEYTGIYAMICNILVATTLIIIWIDYVIESPFKWVWRFRVWLNFKPFNCMWCLSWWVGVMLTACTFDIIYLSLPLITKNLYR